MMMCVDEENHSRSEKPGLIIGYYYVFIQGQALYLKAQLIKLLIA